MWNAQDGLHGCVTAGLPTLETVQAAETTPPDHPAFQCRAAAETDLGTVHGVAWAGRIERAGEEALTELLYSQARAGLSRALEARVKADLEQQQVLIAAALDATLRRVHAGDLAEQARLTCVGVAEGPLPPLAWHLDTLEDLRDCGERTWLPPVEGVASVEALAGVRDDLCHERAWYGVDLVQDALDSTPAELLGAQASSGWAIVLACEAHCASHTYLAAPGPPVAFEGQPDRSTLAAAQAALMDALVLHDPDLLAQVSPVFGSPRMRELMARQPIAMWLRIPALVELAIADGGIAWVEADGQWTLRETDDGR